MRLKYVNKCALADCCGCVPKIWTRPAALSSARRGFLANGMIDNVLKICLSSKNMINAIPRKISDKEWEIANKFENIKTLFEEQKLSNKISENAFDSLGFPIDLGAKGNEVDDLRRSDFMPCQRARAIRPDELRSMKAKLIEKHLEI